MMIRRERARRLPGTIPDDLRDRLIKQCMKEWETHVTGYVRQVVLEVSSHLSALCLTRFGQSEKLRELVMYATSILRSNSSDVITGVVKELGSNTTTGLDEQLSMESRPFTNDRERLTSATESILHSILRYRPCRTYGGEFEVIAHVLAYVDIAYRRFIDIIPMRVEQTFQTKLADNIRLQFEERLLCAEGFEERCRSFMGLDPEIERKRRELSKELEVLRLAEDEIIKVRFQ